MTATDVLPPLQGYHPVASQFRADVVRGLSGRPKSLPCQYFYDHAGSQLFEAITELPEYYLTRTELAIMQGSAAEMAQRIGPRCLLVEFGSGSSTKTRLLLDQLVEPAGYVPVDVSAEHLWGSARRLAQDYPGLEVLPLFGDFTRPLGLPAPRKRPARTIVYFPGSTIGNFTPDEAVLLLRQTADLCGRDGGLLLGADLQKDPRVIEAAYNDSRGVTDAFNLNLLKRINRELGGDFNTAKFQHRAFYNADEGRVEIYLVSRTEQWVRVEADEFHFADGEPILTEFSHKYDPEGLRELAAAGGFLTQATWTDPQSYFSVCYLTPSKC